jgi:hypothetical protein
VEPEEPMKIDAGTYDVAFAAAQSAISNEEALSWLKSSSLIHRAYLYGVLIALDAISDGDYSHKHWLHAFSKTMWGRDADDTCPGTNIGKLYSALLIGRDGPRPPMIDRNVLAELSNVVNQKNEHWRCVTAAGQKMLRDLERADQTQETPDVSGLYGDLENALRMLAVTETSHKLSDRL